MSEDLSNKRFVIFGVQGSGKSVLLKYILSHYPAHLVYDVHHEHEGFNRYKVTYRQVDHRQKNCPAIVELNNLVNSVVLGSGQIRLFVLEEANRYCPNHYPLPDSILVLNDDQRHDRIAFGSIARRPAQLHTDLTELAHYLFIFKLTGRNDYQFLEDTAMGLGDAVRSLPDFHFVVVPPDRSKFYVHAPVSFDEKKVAGGAGPGSTLEASDLTRGQVRGQNSA